MNSYQIFILASAQNVIQFFAVMNGKLIDVQEWQTETQQQRRNAKFAIAQYGCQSAIPWTEIEKDRVFRAAIGDKRKLWKFQIYPGFAINSYHGWRKPEELEGAPTFSPEKLGAGTVGGRWS